MTSDSLPHHDIAVEYHPLRPFLPADGRLLMLGSFPPPKAKWSMNFFYPNKQNDMWRIMGLLFFGNKDHFTLPDGRFDQSLVESFCHDRKIALFDTASAVKRLNNDASDKFLTVVQKSDIASMLASMPSCDAIAVTGQKALDTILDTYPATPPAIGRYTELTISDRPIRLYRMPSSSRAYPLAIEKKAAEYEKMFRLEGLL